MIFLQALREYSRQRIALKIDVISAIPFMRSSLIALLHIKSCLGAFLGFRRRINSNFYRSKGFNRRRHLEGRVQVFSDIRGNFGRMGFKHVI